MSKAKSKPKKKEKAQFTFRMENSKILKSVVETLASIIDETRIMITPKEFTIKAMDPSRICLLKLTIKKGNFDEYSCSGSHNIVVNLDDLDKILKRGTVKDTLTISFSEDEQKIKIIMQQEESTKKRTFRLTLLESEIEEVPLDNLLKISFNANWTMDPDFLTEALKDAEIYSEILNIKLDDNQGLQFSSSGPIGDMEYELDIEDLIESDVTGTSTGAYSLTFLKSILKIASITEKLKISLKTDHPLKMIFSLLEGGDLKYFLAPRVPEQEFEGDDFLEDDPFSNPNEAEEELKEKEIKQEDRVKSKEVE